MLCEYIYVCTRETIYIIVYIVNREYSSYSHHHPRGVFSYFCAPAHFIVP